KLTRRFCGGEATKRSRRRYWPHLPPLLSSAERNLAARCCPAMPKRSKREPPRPHAAQLRGDIDRGCTGDKAPGLDPAAAPMETDAEAGGAPPTPTEIAQARAAEHRPGVQSANPNAVEPKKTPDG